MMYSKLVDEKPKPSLLPSECIIWDDDKMEKPNQRVSLKCSKTFRITTRQVGMSRFIPSPKIYRVQHFHCCSRWLHFMSYYTSHLAACPGTLGSFYFYHAEYDQIDKRFSTALNQFNGSCCEAPRNSTSLSNCREINVIDKMSPLQSASRKLGVHASQCHF